MTSADDRFEYLALNVGPDALAYLARRTRPVEDAANVYSVVLTTTWRRLRVVPADDRGGLRPMARGRPTMPCQASSQPGSTCCADERLRTQVALAVCPATDGSTGEVSDLTAWLTAVPAMTAHLPLVAAFSLLPLVCLRYLGAGRSWLAAAVVVGLMAATGLAFAVFFDDFPPPLAAAAPLSSSVGEGVGSGVHALFLGTVLLGPGAALVAAGREDSPAGVRLRTVGLASGAGSILVMACAVLAGAGDTSLPADTAAVVIYVGAFAAVVVAATGAVRALRLPDVSVPPAHLVLEPASTDQEGAPGADAVEQSAATTASADGGTTDLDARADAPLGVPPLTAREREVLQLLALGLSNAGIAAQLVLSQRTVDAHLRSVFTNLDLPEGPTQNRRVLAARAFASAAQLDSRVPVRGD